MHRDKFSVLNIFFVYFFLLVVNCMFQNYFFIYAKLLMLRLILKMLFIYNKAVIYNKYIVLIIIFFRLNLSALIGYIFYFKLKSMLINIYTKYQKICIIINTCIKLHTLQPYTETVLFDPSQML